MAKPEHEANPNKRQTTGVAYGLYANQHVVAIPFYDQDFRTQVDQLSDSEQFISRIIHSIVNSQADMEGTRQSLEPVLPDHKYPKMYDVHALTEIQLIVRGSAIRESSPQKAGKPLKEFTIEKKTPLGTHTIKVTYLQGTAALSEANLAQHDSDNK